MKKLLVILIGFFLFAALTPGKAHALRSVPVGTNPARTVALNFCNGQPTNWQVHAVYYNHNDQVEASKTFDTNNTAAGCPGAGYTWYIDNAIPEAGDYVIWYQACVDPKVQVVTTGSFYLGDGFGGHYYLYETDTDIRCHAIGYGGTAPRIYRGCSGLSYNTVNYSNWGPYSGVVTANGQCPYLDTNDSYCTQGGVTSGTLCQNSGCGGAGNCTYYNKTCSGTSCSRPGTTYSTRCGGNNIAGTNMCGAWSATCAPGAPTVTLSAICNGTNPNIRVNYVPNSGGPGNRSYDLRWRVAGGAWSNVCSPPASGAGYDYIITSAALNDDTDYQVQVREHTDAAYNGPTNFGSATVTTPICNPSFTVSGTVYEDTNSNGVLDAGDAPYTGGALVNITATRAKTSDASGKYSFSAVNGSYSLTITAPAGYNIVGANPVAVVVNGANVTGINFLVINSGAPPPPPPPPTTYSISGYVFRDDNGNGIKDGAETNTAGTIGITNSSGTTTNISTGGGGTFTAGLLAPDDYTVSLQDNLASINWEATYPPQGVLTAPSTQVSLGPCNVSNFNNGLPSAVASCDANDNIVNLTFGIRPIPQEPWFQGVGGDIRADQGLQNPMPLGKYLSDGAGILSSGVVFGNGLDLGRGSPNPSNWIVDHPFAASPIRMSYDQVSISIAKSGTNKINLFASSHPLCSGSTCSFSTPPPAGAYVSDRSITLTGASTFSGNNVFLIDGDLTIQGNITVNPGSTAIFVVSGKITVDSGVTNIAGIFSADETFTVNGGGSSTDQPLQIQGSVVANALKNQVSGYFVNNRDLGGQQNINTPSVQFRYRPDFVLNAPSFIRYASYQLKEVAPGGN